MQYFKPNAPDLFFGDPMPFFHDGVFHLYYLLDEKHHALPFGRHQWAHASTRDLASWEHHPLAVPVGAPGASDERGICTGSVFHHNGVFYAHYATRIPDAAGVVRQHLCRATSRDGIHFTKRTDNPFASPPPGYSVRAFRDPFIFRDNAGRFHMLVTACLDPGPLPGRNGCLAHLVSDDLERWQPQDPFLVPGLNDAPECPDYFEWNGWHYLIFSVGLVARYRMSRGPFGPWLAPAVDTFDGPMFSVMKTAPFTGGRRIGVGFLRWREGEKDDGRWLWGGNGVFREILQRADGTLATRFPAEMIPDSGPHIVPLFKGLTCGVTATPDRVRVSAPQGFGAAVMEGVPADARITLGAKAKRGAAHFGIGLRGSGNIERGYLLRCSPAARRLSLCSIKKPTLGDRAENALLSVAPLDKPLRLEIVMKGDIIDVCLNGDRTLINRFPEERGDRMFLFCENGDVEYQGIEIRGV